MAYVLGHKVTHFAVQVETHVWWNGGWQLQLHKVHAHQPATLTVGGQSLPVNDDGHFVELRAVAGWDDSETIRHNGDDRTHIMAESSEYPILTTAVDGEKTLINLAYCGKTSPAGWNVESLDESGIVLKSDDGSVWEVSFA